MARSRPFTGRRRSTARARAWRRPASRLRDAGHSAPWWSGWRGRRADQIPPSLGAPAVRSHCVRMDGGAPGEIEDETKTVCPVFSRQVNFFWNRAGGARCIIVGPLLGEHCRSPRPGNTGAHADRRRAAPGHPRVGGEHASGKATLSDSLRGRFGVCSRKHGAAWRTGPDDGTAGNRGAGGCRSSVCCV